MMARNSAIEWTDATWNPWIGCTKVSDGCKYCYAETLMDKRYGRVEWGPQGTRVRTSDANWRKPVVWDKQAKAEGRRVKVFCASLADVFEDRQELIMWRVDLLYMIERTSHLDWLLLTKRPENVMDMIAQATGRHPEAWLADRKNVWIGTSVEDEKTADERIPHLLRIPAQFRFLSMEPLLGPVNLTAIDDHTGLDVEGYTMLDVLRGFSWDPVTGEYGGRIPKVDWVIVGGESGHDARAMKPQWVRDLRDQCVSANTPFFFKQWGEWRPADKYESTPGNVSPKDLARWWAKGSWQPTSEGMFRAGKKAAGRMLDGREWSEFPRKDEA